MDILVVGNVLKDVYLNLDGRTTEFETDKRGTEWLNIGFNASSYNYFNCCESLSGAAITLEVLEKLGLFAKISGEELSFAKKREFGGVERAEEKVSPNETGIREGRQEEVELEERGYPDGTGRFIGDRRYILLSEEGACYFCPERLKETDFVVPKERVGCIYIDNSANLTTGAAKKIEEFLVKNPETQLVIYYKEGRNLDSLVERAALVFIEEPLEGMLVAQLREGVKKTFVADGEVEPSRGKVAQILLSEKEIRYQGIVERIEIKNIDKMTKMSAYSLISSTVLGCFALGQTVEESLKFAKINVENAKINASLSLSELREAEVMGKEDIELIAASLVYRGKGILAADESGGSIKKKFAALNIPDTFQNRHEYRDIFFTTPGLAKYVNGVILFDETARDYADNGQTYVDFLTSKQIIPGIKVDQGLVPFREEEGEVEMVTQGLEGLSERLKEYYTLGLRFAKWRAAFNEKPSQEVVDENCRRLTEYALECQKAGIVPIVEPEVVYDGDYSIDKCAETTERILDCLFGELRRSGVNLRALLLKCNMVLAGKRYAVQSTPEEVGFMTATVLKKCVPSEVAGVVFLSGGQTPEQATQNLAAVLRNGPFEWPVTFSFARALQEPALYTWKGDNSKKEEAKAAFLERLKENAEALEFLE